jgi:Glycosyltransferase family 87
LKSIIDKTVIACCHPLFIMAVSIGFLISELHLGRNDFDIFFQAGQDIKQGKDLYRQTYFDGYHYYNSILFALALSLFGETQLLFAKCLWMCINMLMLWRIFRLCAIYTSPTSGINLTKYNRIFGLLLFLICLRLIKSNLHFGQLTIFTLYLSLEGLSAIWRKQSWGGWLIALAINVKLLPLVLVPYLAYRAQWRGFAAVIIGVTSFTFFPLVFMNSDYFCQLMGSYFQLINPVQTKHMLDVEETTFHGLTTFISTLFHASAVEHNGLHLRRHLVDLPFDVVVLIIQTVRLAIVILTLAYLRANLFAKTLSNLQLWFEWSWLLAVIPLLFPHQQQYAFLMQMPAIAYILCRLLTGPSRPIVAILTSMITLTFNLSLILATYTAYFNHYKILTWGALALLVVLYLERPPRQAQASA